MLGQSTHEFMKWVQETCNQLIGDPTPLPAPTVTTTGLDRGIQVTWTEVGTIGQQFIVLSYQIFEQSNAAQPGPGTIPIAVVPTNHGGTQNTYIRSSIFDLNTRFYSVRAVSPTGVLGSFSGSVPGKASSIA